MRIFLTIAAVILLQLFTQSALAEEFKVSAIKDGSFMALMMVSDESSISELQKPSTEAPHIKAIEKFKRGEEVVINFVFSGMEVSSDSEADVSFDLKLLKEGKVYSSIDMQNITALKRKILNPSFIYHNSESTTISFDKNDASGKYEIIAKLRDNIGKKEISFKKEIELID